MYAIRSYYGKRIEALLATLGSQAFVPAAVDAAKRGTPYTFAFESCKAAVAAYRERFAKMAEREYGLVSRLELRFDKAYARFVV